MNRMIASWVWIQFGIQSYSAHSGTVLTEKEHKKHVMIIKLHVVRPDKVCFASAMPCLKKVCQVLYNCLTDLPLHGITYAEKWLSSPWS